MKIFVALVIICLTPHVFATGDPNIDVIYKYERQYGIPKGLFHAIALQESGRPVDGVMTIWPWALNIGGESFYFESRLKAYERLKAEVDNGRKKQLGVGIGQLEFEYHRDKFNTLWDMLDPELNIRASSGFLLECYKRSSSWVAAIALYHAGSVNTSQRLTNATNYVLKVRKHHAHIL